MGFIARSETRTVCTPVMGRGVFECSGSEIRPSQGWKWTETNNVEARWLQGKERVNEMSPNSRY